MLLVLIGSIAPDIDGDGSITRPGRILERLLPRSAARTLDSLGQVIGKLIRLVFGHRGFFHWPILALVLIGASAYFKLEWLFWFGIGYSSHILGDFLTKGGVPVFAPLSFKARSALPIKTGSSQELLLFGLLMLYLLIQGPALLPKGVQEALHEFFGRSF